MESNVENMQNLQISDQSQETSDQNVSVTYTTFEELKDFFEQEDWKANEEELNEFYKTAATESQSTDWRL